jgi:hypothetical protein
MAFQEIDTSSGALGNAVNRALDELIPVLISAPADAARMGRESLHPAQKRQSGRYPSDVAGARRRKGARWSPNMGATTEGCVADVHVSGIEAENCEARDALHRDIQIPITPE